MIVGLFVKYKVLHKYEVYKVRKNKESIIQVQSMIQIFTISGT